LLPFLSASFSPQAQNASVTSVLRLLDVLRLPDVPGMRPIAFPSVSLPYTVLKPVFSGSGDCLFPFFTGRAAAKYTKKAAVQTRASYGSLNA